MTENSKHADAFLENFDTGKDNNELSYQNIVIAGENLSHRIKSQSQTVKYSIGLSKCNNDIYSTSCGYLNFKSSVYWVDYPRRHYYPSVGDQIVGIIDDKGSDYYRVNIFCGSSCMLSRLAFEGATKRNKPELKRGDVIYARILKCHKDFDIELTCISTSGNKKDWSSGESVSNDAIACYAALIMHFKIS
jgi:exosome complex component RRP40